MKTLTAILALVFASAASPAMALCDGGPPCPGDPYFITIDDPVAQTLGIPYMDVTPWGMDFYSESGRRNAQVFFRGVNSDVQAQLDVYYRIGSTMRFLGIVAYDFHLPPTLTFTNASGESRAVVGDVSTSPPQWRVTRGADVYIPDNLIVIASLAAGYLPPAIHDASIQAGVIQQGMLCEGCYTASLYCEAEWRCCQDCYNYRTGGLPGGGTGGCSGLEPLTAEPFAASALCGGNFHPFSCTGIQRFSEASGATRSRAKANLKEYLNQDCRNDLCGGCCGFTEPDCGCIFGDFLCFCIGRGTPCTSP